MFCPFLKFHPFSKKPLEYYVIEKCTAENNKEISKTLKVAEPSDNHILNTDGKNAVKDAVDEAKKDGALSVNSYNALKANAEKYGIKLTVADACEADGTLTITSYCTICGKEVSTVSMKVKKLGHEYGATVEENVVEATCGKDGSYDAVHYCKNCGNREVVRESVVVKATGKHSFKDEKGNTDQTDAYIAFSGSIVVDINGENLNNKGKTYSASQLFKDFTVSADAVVKCEICGEAETLKNLQMTVVDITKDDSTNGYAGSITLKASYTKQLADNKTEKIESQYTVPYYSNLVNFLDRNPEQKVNGLHQDRDGIFRYYVNNEFQSDFAGIVEYDGGEFFVANGVLCSGANGLNEYNGKWYFLSAGQIQRGYNSLALYDGEWFYLNDGELDTTVNGLVKYDGGTFLFAEGRLVKEHNGLWQDFDGTWYFLALGQVQDQFTGTTVYDGATFELVDGKLVA